jgi:hypothetical protein
MVDHHHRDLGRSKAFYFDNMALTDTISTQSISLGMLLVACSVFRIHNNCHVSVIGDAVVPEIIILVVSIISLLITTCRGRSQGFVSHLSFSICVFAWS